MTIEVAIVTTSKNVEMRILLWTSLHFPKKNITIIGHQEIELTENK